MAEFSRIIQAMDGGRVEQDLSALLHTLVTAVVAADRTGSLKLNVVVSPGSNTPGRDRRIVNVTVHVKRQIPGAPESQSSSSLPVILYAGRLSPLDEMQLRIFEPDE